MLGVRCQWKTEGLLECFKLLCVPLPQQRGYELGTWFLAEEFLFRPIGLNGPFGFSILSGFTFRGFGSRFCTGNGISDSKMMKDAKIKNDTEMSAKANMARANFFQNRLPVAIFPLFTVFYSVP